MPRIAIIADDLTGALDAAAPFASRGERTIVAAAPRYLEDALALHPDVVSVSTNTREGPSQVAAAETLGAAAKLRATPLVFKKVDSRLKGHVRAEASALARYRGCASVLLCPAIPEFGRVVRGGHLSGFGVDTPEPWAEAFDRSDPAILLADASTETDLDDLVDQALARGNQLLAGARGLAAAVARRSGPATASSWSLGGPVSIGVGSRDPISVLQVARLRDAGPDIPVMLAPNGVFTGRVPDAAVVLLQASAGAHAADPADVQAAFAASLVPAFSDRRATLILTGGATAAAVLARLGIGLVRVLGEAMPGIVVSRAIGPDAPLDIVTKSGGFGAPAALVELVGLCGRSSRPLAGPDEG